MKIIFPYTIICTYNKKINFPETEMQYKIQKTHTQENNLYHSSTDLQTVQL